MLQRNVFATILLKSSFIIIECNLKYNLCINKKKLINIYIYIIYILNYIKFLYIGLSGKSVPILKENWNAEDLNFSIHLLNYRGAILFYNLSPPFRQLKNSFQNLSGFSAKNFSKWFFTSTKELKLFPLREFCNDRDKWKSEGARSVEYGGWSRTSQSSSNNFCRVIKDTWAHCLETRRRFAISGRFCSIAVFNLSNWEQYFSEFIVSLFSKSS